MCMYMASTKLNIKSLCNAATILDALTSELDGIMIKIHNSKMTDIQEEEVVRIVDGIDTNIARISAMRARLYEHILTSQNL